MNASKEKNIAALQAEGVALAAMIRNTQFDMTELQKKMNATLGHLNAIQDQYNLYSQKLHEACRAHGMLINSWEESLDR